MQTDSALVGQQRWPDSCSVLLHDPATQPCAQQRVERVQLLSVGGGLGSFTLLDTLRIAGVPADAMATIGPHRSPIRQYETALANSGIGLEGRLRSESCSTLDNPWGFPGYAIRESIRRRTPGPVLRVLSEPLAAEYYTPKRCDVVASVTKECERIGWSSMLRRGMVQQIRKTVLGYAVRYRTPEGDERSVLADNIHLALGPGPPRILDDSAAVNAVASSEPRRVYHVYEPHEAILDAAASRAVTVAVRGSGIAGSHAVDRLIVEQMRSHPDLRIIHIIRQPPSSTRQAFNVPKAAWGGQFQQRLERSEGAERDALLRHLAATTIPKRGAVASRRRSAIRSHVLTEIVHPDPRLFAQNEAVGVDVGDDQPRIAVDFVIDATGFQSGVQGQPIVDDFLAAAGTGPNRRDRLDVDRCFGVAGLDTVVGRAYVSGSLAFGDRYGAPDTFLGLTYSGHHIARDLALRNIGAAYTPRRSMGWWLRWARGVTP